MNPYESDDIKISMTTETITIWFKKEKRLVIAEYKYLVYLDKLIAIPNEELK